MSTSLKKAAGYVAIFVLGFLACAIIVKWTGTPATTGGETIATTKSVGKGSPLTNPGSNPFATAAAKVEKFVVSINTKGQPIAGLPSWLAPFELGPSQEIIPEGHGSGVIIRPDGYILTNNHVISGATTISVTLSDGRQFPAKVVGRDPKTDLAVIKIPANRLPSAVFLENPNELSVGDWVIAVGNPLALGPTVTVGVVSAKERGPLNIEGHVLENVIQTDAAINRGNSGGALADINGNVVGINTAIASTNPGGGNIGIGFAIPSNTAKWVADQIVKSGKVVRPWIGIKYTMLDDRVKAQLRSQGEAVPPVTGALILEVISGSPADRSGLMPLDVITKVNGKSVKSASTISNTITSLNVGDIVDMEIWQARTKKTVKIAVRTAEMPDTLR